METFHYFINQKITTWQRVKFSIQAETEDEANKKAKEVLADSNECPDNSEYEIIYEASEDMEIEENGGCATRELFSDDGTEIANNAED
jgi:hypothetical protein